MLDVAEQIAEADRQLLNCIARRVDAERKLRPNLDYLQLLALKEYIAEFEARNQRLRRAPRLVVDAQSAPSRAQDIGALTGKPTQEAA